MRRRSGADSSVISLVIAPSRPEQALAADADHLPRDARRTRLGEPRDGLGDVLGVAPLLERVHAPPDLPRREGDPRRHLGLDEAGGDRVDGDATIGDLTRQGGDEPDDAGLARAVVRLAPVARDARDRGDAHDTAAVAEAALAED